MCIVVSRSWHRRLLTAVCWRESCFISLPNGGAGVRDCVCSCTGMFPILNAFKTFAKNAGSKPSGGCCKGTSSSSSGGGCCGGAGAAAGAGAGAAKASCGGGACGSSDGSASSKIALPSSKVPPALALPTPLLTYVPVCANMAPTHVVMLPSCDDWGCAVGASARDWP